MFAVPKKRHSIERRRYRKFLSWHDSVSLSPFRETLDVGGMFLKLANFIQHISAVRPAGKESEYVAVNADIHQWFALESLFNYLLDPILSTAPKM
ncbi:unnamed protein product [Schistocephalus solidus]|uniref:Uncharacterized protein n=1 Tax=Schistocephalus solidus TaxID=70667 RepID=A0A3P7CEB3_SCHSO|nr:unnamed protein product [Schistocephalus solidus]